MTDMVSLGSPLHHVALLLADSADDLQRRAASREFPTCPPALEDGAFSYPEDYTTVTPGDWRKVRRTVRLPHHAACFGPVRWTNLYFPGDLIGGPLRGLFGNGILDVELRSSAWSGILGRTPRSHTHYWETTGGDGPDPHLAALREALDLDWSDR